VLKLTATRNGYPSVTSSSFCPIRGKASGTLSSTRTFGAVSQPGLTNGAFIEIEPGVEGLVQ